MKRVMTRALVVGMLCFVSLLSPAAAPKDPDPLAGFWEWKGPVDTKKAHTEFTIWIDREGNAVSGTYSVNDYIGGEWQGEDGNKTPFRGELRDGRVVVDFDTTATVPGTDEDVMYKAPEDGRKPSTATIVPKGTTLEWTLTSGDPIEGVPSKLVLARAKK